MTEQLDKERTRGVDAEYLMEHYLFREAIDTLRKEITSQWEQSPVRDEGGRERLWLTMKLLGRIEGHIKTIAETGKLARRQLTDLEDRRSVLNLFGGTR